MIDGKSVLGIIPARGGSKGLPRKNLLNVGGRPMLAWGIEAAKTSRYIDRTVVSTDSEEIAAVARQCGGEVPVMRPAAFAQDDSPIELAILHMLDAAGADFDYFVMMEPTVPLKTSEDIDGCIALCAARHAPACVAVSEPPQPPYWMVTIAADQRVQLLLGSEALSQRRQTLPKAYTITGAAYVAKTDWYRKTRRFIDPLTVAYVTPPERSVDVDTALDLLVVNSLLCYKADRSNGNIE